MARDIYDISQTLRPDLPVWPGDTSFHVEPTWEIGEECPVLVSRLTMSTHSGTHADAPSHYDETGVDSAESDLMPYIGRCHVVHAAPGNDAVSAEDIRHLLAEEEVVERILIRTFPEFPHGHWPDPFRAIDPALIRLLHDRGCCLVGTDTPSLDPLTSKTMDAHMAIRDNGMSILEGLVLDDVPEGQYELIALPLKIMAADASPVRAVLRPPG